MAKRGALEHPKTLDLAERLGLDDCFALGILEAFWHHVSKYFNDGDVTALKPGVCARSIRYTRSGQELFEALEGAGFLDRLEDGRLLVHDWSHHADDSVHSSLYKAVKPFADGTKPKEKSVQKSEQERLRTLWEQFDSGSKPPSTQPAISAAPETDRSEVDTKPVSNRSETAKPIPKPMPIPEPKPEVGEDHKPSSRQDAASRAAPAVRRDELDRWWDEFKLAYPKRDGDLSMAKAKQIFDRLVKSGTSAQSILDGVKRYRRWADATGKTRGPYVKQMPSWLNGKAWEEAWEIPFEVEQSANKTRELSVMIAGGKVCHFFRVPESATAAEIEAIKEAELDRIGETEWHNPAVRRSA